MISNNDYGTQLKNIGIQLKNLGTQILNDGMLNQTIFQTQLQNMGTQISNMGIQIFNYGTEIVNIMNNINMLNMMNQMNINMMQMLENMNNNNFVEKKIKIVNILFDYRANRRNIQISEEATVAEALTKYIESEFKDEYKKKIYFLYNDKRMNIKDYKNIKIKDYLGDGSVIEVIEVI